MRSSGSSNRGNSLVSWLFTRGSGILVRITHRRAVTRIFRASRGSTSPFRRMIRVICVPVARNAFGDCFARTFQRDSDVLAAVWHVINGNRPNESIRWLARRPVNDARSLGQIFPATKILKTNTLRCFHCHALSRHRISRCFDRRFNDFPDERLINSERCENS